MTVSLERWLPVVGWEDLYTVSNLGRVKSHHRSTPRILRPAPSGPRGYLTVNLCRNGTGTTRTVHSLVAEAFAGPCPSGQEVRHLDGNPANNRWAPGDEGETKAAGGNLFYGTPSENNFDRVQHGTHPNANKKKCSNGHDFTPENTILTLRPDGSIKRRGCRICRNGYVRDLTTRDATTDEDRCTEDGCSRRKFSKGLCSKHYQQKRREENPELLREYDRRHKAKRRNAA